MVVIDATMLLLFLRPETAGPKDAEGKSLKYARQRVEYLIADLDKKRGAKIAIPTPALSEVLVRMGRKEAQDVVSVLNDHAVFVIEPFDQRAAIELALMLRKKPKGDAETYAKLKFDRQIVATAKVCGASAIYSDDDGIHTLGERVEIPVYRVRDLPIPAAATQTELTLAVDETPEPEPEDEEEAGEE